MPSSRCSGPPPLFSWPGSSTAPTRAAGSCSAPYSGWGCSTRSALCGSASGWGGAGPHPPTPLARDSVAVARGRHRVRNLRPPRLVAGAARLAARGVHAQRNEPEDGGEVTAGVRIRAASDHESRRVPLLAGGSGLLLRDGGRKAVSAPRLDLDHGLLLVGGERLRSSNYLAPAYSMLLAAGAVAFERLASARAWRWLPGATAGIFVLGGAATAPMAISLLPPARYVTYEHALGIAPPVEQVDELGAMPLHFALRFGWTELIGAVAEAYATLSPDEREKARVLGTWFGDTAAVNFFGAERDCPVPSRTQQLLALGPGRREWRGPARSRRDGFEAARMVRSRGARRGGPLRLLHARRGPPRCLRMPSAQAPHRRMVAGGEAVRVGC